MGPELMNFCKLEILGTTEHGKMRIQVLAKDWKIEGQKGRNYQDGV